MSESIKERLNKLDALNEAINEFEKKENAPKRSMWDKITGKKKVGKEFKLPAKIRRGVKSKKKVKQNYAILIYVRTNGYADIDYAPIEDDMIYSKQSGLYHLATTDYIMRYKKFPLIIVPEWSLEPFSPKKSLVETIEEGKLSLPQKAIINMVKLAQLGPKKSAISPSMIWIVLGVIVAIYLLSKVFVK